MLAELIHPLALMEHQEWEYRPRPSNAGPDHCIRKLTYHARHAPAKSPSGRFLVVLDDSTWHEELVLNWIAKSTFHLHSQQLELTCATTTFQGQPFPIKGHIDGVITDLLGIDRLLELKAVEHFTFTRYAEGNYPTNYLVQVVFYLVGLAALNPHIDEALLLIKNKNQSAFLEYRVRYDRENDHLTVLEITHSTGTRVYPHQDFVGLYQEALRRFEEVEQYRDQDALPPRPYPNDDNFHCAYCPYQFCWEGVDQVPIEGIAELRTGLVPAVEEYLNLQTELAALTPKQKRLDALKQQFKLELRTEGITRAEGHGYYIASSPYEQSKLDQTKLSKATIERATVKETYSRFSAGRLSKVVDATKPKRRSPLKKPKPTTQIA
ncbi:MAG: hypothetical protein DYH03_00130 [Nitrospira sp. NTP1]|jgi:hypothetical protein|nr:hypothetical protein [Nitrospira sp. NTP1]